MITRVSHILLITILLSSLSLYAQELKNASSSEEIVNIKALVDQQIKKIKEAEAAKDETIIKKEAESVKSQADKDTIVSTLTSSGNLFIKKSVFSKLFIIIEAILFISILLLWYKRKSNSIKESKKILKANIKRLREEKIGGLLDKKLSRIRSKLILQPVALDGRSITEQAKRLSISKGELHLAAKINLLSKQV